MKLPNAEAAKVDIGKLQDYLLADDHPTGCAKAQFFKRLGFDPNRPLQLGDALRGVALAGEVLSINASAFGTSTSWKVRSSVLTGLRY